MTLIKRASASEIAVTPGAHARNVGRWTRNRLVHGSDMDAGWYCGMLQPDEFGTAMEEIWKGY